MSKELALGGQAVIEGVLMKTKTGIAIAIRKKNKIKIKKQRFESIVDRNPALNIPIVRGVIYLFEIMVLGMKALTYSANQQGEKQEELTKLEIFLTFLFAIVATILIFVAAPFYLTKLISKEIGIIFNLIDGAFRLAIFLLYIVAISAMKDIRRVFQYHGAEHKAVHCYENHERLTVKNVKKYPTAHPRCGTTFLVIVIALSIVVFSLIKDPRWYINILARIILIPVIAGVSYEFLKLGARYKHNLLIKVLIQPGIWVQALTTREPDNKQIEVAVASLKAVLK